MIKIQGSQYPSDFEAKKAIVEIGKQMAQRGYVIASDGSLSVKVGPNAVWTTTEEAQKGGITQDMMVRVDLEGKMLLGARSKTLSEETKIHLKLYREHPEIRAVLHGYPPVATAMGIRGIEIVSAGHTKTLRKLGDVPVVPYRGTDTDPQSVATCAGKCKGVLLQNNGCMTWGESLSEAYSGMEAIEYAGGIIAALGGKAPRVLEPRLRGVTELVTPEKEVVVSVQTSDVIHRTNERVEKEKVTEKPREDVMAEVVRRTMNNFH